MSKTAVMFCSLISLVFGGPVLAQPQGCITVQMSCTRYQNGLSSDNPTVEAIESHISDYFKSQNGMTIVICGSRMRIDEFGLALLFDFDAKTVTCTMLWKRSQTYIISQDSSAGFLLPCRSPTDSTSNSSITNLDEASSETFNGSPCRHYSTTVKTKSSSSRTDIVCVQNVNIDPRLSKVLSSYLGLRETANGVPISVETTTTANGSGLSTDFQWGADKITREPVSPAIFEIPANYSPAPGSRIRTAEHSISTW